MPAAAVAVQHPGMRLVKQLAEREDIVLPVVVRLFPFLALLVAPARRNAEPRPFVALVAPDRDFHGAVPQLVYGFLDLSVVGLSDMVLSFLDV